MNVVAAAGGSGGHCYPAVAFLQACKERHPDWTLTLAVNRGARTMGLELEAAAARAVVEVESAKFAGARSLVTPAFWSKIFRGLKESRRLLTELKADVVVGFGGYGSFPLVWEAASMKIPTVVHEQNAVMGTANRFLRSRAARLAVSIELAASPSAASGGRIVRTGFPVRSTLRRLDREAVIRRLELDPKKKTLLVFGGSQGSRFINRLVTDTLVSFGDKLGADWQVLHLTGRAAASDGRTDELRPFLDPDLRPGSGRFYRQWPYSREMDALYTAADLVVCRAGSATLHELSYYGRPAILIPYPHANAHQLFNARVPADGGAAWILEENGCSPRRFKELLDQAAAQPETLQKMGQNCSKALKTDGAAALVDLVESLS